MFKGQKKQELRERDRQDIQLGNLETNSEQDNVLAF